MTSATLDGWQPQTPAFYRRPVQVEDATGGLCGTEMPDGRGCLVWPNGGEAHFAVVPSPEHWLQDDVVTAGDIGVVASPGSVTRTSVWCIDGELCATVVTWTGSATTTKIYRADDASNPASWSVVATLQDDLTPGSRFGMEDWGAALPLQLDSGRLVLVQGCWQFGSGPGDPESGANSGAWTSDGGAAGPWTLRNQYRHPYPGFSRIAFCSPQLAMDPATGFLYYSTATGTGGPDYPAVLWESQDQGTTWDLHGQVVPPGGSGGWLDTHQLAAAVDNGQQVFAWGGGPGSTNQFATVLARTGDAHDIIRFLGSPGWTDTGRQWLPYSISDADPTRKAVVVLGSSRGVHTFWSDRASHLPVGGWMVGQQGFA